MSHITKTETSVILFIRRLDELTILTVPPHDGSQFHPGTTRPPPCWELASPP